MRLPEAKIREAIVHPDIQVRQEALQYFADSFSRDPEVLPMAIQAIERYGRDDAFLFVHHLANLAQTEATVAWAVEQLRRETQPQPFDPYLNALSNLLCAADPDLLAPHADAIVQAPGFLNELIPAFRERLELASWDAERCWAELEAISASGVGKFDISQVNFERAERVVEVLARHGHAHVDRLLDLLGRKIDDPDNDPMGWMELFVVQLAGEMRLPAAIPLLVAKLPEGDEGFAEECIIALARIGTDAAAEALTAGWETAEWGYQLSAIAALERIHTDTTVRRCLELLPLTTELDTRTGMADALLSQMADEAIEPVRQMVRDRAYDEGWSDLMGKLVAVSTLLDVTFPEFPIWKRETETKRKRQLRQMNKRAKLFSAPLLLPPALPMETPSEPALPAHHAPVPLDAPVPEKYPEPNRVPIQKTGKQVGRNDPCPCGSGKKYKKCCMSHG
ncbi:MAG: SEC-C metal-binding domain-containing protein [Gemmataceae bacterium]